MSTLFQEVAMIYFICAGVYQTLVWIYDLSMWLERTRNVKRYPVKCSNYKVDDKYDELINKILDEGTPIGISGYRMYFSYNGKEYGIWIENKRVAYGSSLSSSNPQEVIIDGRAPKKETLYKLYEKELLANKKNSTKYKEDQLIAQLLSDSED